MKKVLILFILFFSTSSFGKVEIDTINNWQLYKDKTLIFKSNEIEKNNQVISIKSTENFKILKFNMFYDFFGDKTLKKMQFIVDNKIIKTFVLKNEARNSFIITKESIKSLIKKYKNKVIQLKYFDKIYTEGISVCKIKFI